MSDNDPVNASRRWTGGERSGTDGCDVNCVGRNAVNSRNSYTTRDRATAAREHNDDEIENTNRQLDVYKKRTDGVSVTNGRLRRAIKKTIQTNPSLEQRLTCPYAVDVGNGEVTFPGKEDLDKRLDGLFREAEKIKARLKTFEDDALLICKLKTLLNSPLPKCLGNCHGNVNEE